MARWDDRGRGLIYGVIVERAYVAVSRGGCHGGSFTEGHLRGLLPSVKTSSGNWGEDSNFGLLSSRCFRVDSRSPAIPQTHLIKSSWLH